MARKRFITSDISTDEKVAAVAEENPVVALMWPWFNTAFDDWGRMIANPIEVKLTVFPAFTFASKDISVAIQLYDKHGLAHHYEIDGKAYLAVNPATWYKYQTYIKAERKEKQSSKFPAPVNPPWGKEKSATIADNQRQSAKNVPSLSPSLSQKDLKDLLVKCGFEGSDQNETPQPEEEPDETAFNFPEEYWSLVEQIDALPEDKQLDMLVVQYGKKYPAQRKSFGTGGVVTARKKFKETIDLSIPASEILKEILFDLLDEEEPEPKPWDITGYLVTNRGLQQTRAQMHYEMALQLERGESHEQCNTNQY